MERCPSSPRPFSGPGQRSQHPGDQRRLDGADSFRDTLDGPVLDAEGVGRIDGEFVVNPTEEDS